MKPDFKSMSRKELRSYILSHKDDNEAIEELFVNRRDPNAQRFPYPYDLSEEEREEVETIFRNALEKKNC